MPARKLNTKSDLNLDIANSNENLTPSHLKDESISRPLWGGFFNNTTDELTKKMLNTSHLDKRLYPLVIDSTKAQLRMHLKRNIIPEIEGKKLIEGLDKIKKEISEGKLSLNQSQHDVYDILENRLHDLCGSAVECLYIARSKNDQTAGDLKMWVREACDNLENIIQAFQAVLIDKAEENVRTIMPGYTHMQVEQPISMGHQFMAYVEMFARDRGRIKDMRARLNTSPFGSNSLGGSAFHINREMVSRALGFDKATANSIDAVSDRDYVIEFLSFASICSIHLSRIAEDMLFWHNPNNDFISFSDAFINRNSISPLKRDPKIIELVRGKVGKIFGALTNSLSTLKALPIGYSQDLSELTEPVFEAYDVLINNINVMTMLVTDFMVNRKHLKEAAQYGYSTVTDLANWMMINLDMSLSQAMVTTRHIIDLAVEKESKLSLLEMSDLQAIEPRINDEIYSVLIASRTVISRRSVGGTNPVQVRKAIRAARRKYL